MKQQHSNLVVFPSRKTSGFYPGSERRETLQSLLHGLRQPARRLSVISGPDGVGKTRVLEELCKQIPAHYRLVQLQGYYGSSLHALQDVARQLGLDCGQADTPAELMRELGRQLEQGRQHSQNGEVITIAVLFDDAHGLPLPVIRELVACLANGHCNLSAVLTVDSETVDVIRHFLRRFDVQEFCLPRLGRDALPEYLAHGDYHAANFDSLELDRIFQQSDGIPARIDQQARYCLRLRAVKAAEQPETQAVSAMQMTAVARLRPIAAAACLAVGMAALLGLPLQQASVPLWNGQDAALADQNLLEMEEPLDEELYADSAYEVELPEEFEEFSDHLSDDEIALLQTEPEQYALQLMAGDSEEDMQAFVEEYREHQVMMYRSLANGQPWFKAVAAGFPDREAAAELIDSLPDELQDGEPWIRTVASVQQEILSMGEHLSEQQDGHASLESWLAALLLPADSDRAG